MATHSKGSYVAFRSGRNTPTRRESVAQARVAEADRCKIRCALFPETPLDSPARSCTYDPEYCGCNRAESNGFCYQRIPAVS